MDVLEKLNQACHEAGICEPGIKHAAEFYKDGSKKVVRLACFEDGVITSCVVEVDGEGKTKEKVCCYSTEPGQEAAFWAFEAHLTSPEVGYKIRRVEVEGGE